MDAFNTHAGASPGTDRARHPINHNHPWVPAQRIQTQAGGRLQPIRRSTRLLKLSLFAWMTLLLYGSWLPFQLKPVDRHLGWSAMITHIGLHPSSPEDMLTNLFVYLPLGFVTVLLAATTLGRMGGVVLAWMLGVIASIIAESGQGFMAERVASWVDVRVDVLGAVAGAVGGLIYLLVSRPVASAVRQRWSADPWGAAGTWIAVGILVASLVPFQFTLHPLDIQQSFLRANLNLWGTPAKPDSPGTVSVRAWVGDLRGAGCFMAFAFVLAAAGRRNGLRRMVAVSSAVVQTLLLAVLVELLQLFSLVHVSQLGDVAWRSVAGTIGAAVGAGVGAGQRGSATDPGDHRRRVLAVPQGILILAWIAQAVLILFESAFDRRPATSDSPASIIGLPFADAWRQPASTAFTHLAEQALVYALLAATTVMIVSRIRIRSPGRLALGFMVIWLLLMVGITLSATGSCPSTTELFVALGMSVLVAEMLGTGHDRTHLDAPSFGLSRMEGIPT